MNEIKLLNEQEVLGKQFKVYGTPEEPLFLAKDVAEWLDLSNTTDMVSRVDEDEVTKLNLGGLQGECNFLTEDGLYEVLMQSRKPIAKEFKKEVKNILKTIRKSGGYVNNAEKMVDTYFSDIPDEQKTIIQGLLVGIEEKQKKIKTLTTENDLLSQKTLEWADRAIINALVRAYGHGIGDDYARAWRDFKKELLYRYSINLNARQTAHLNAGGSKKKKKLDFLNDEELPQAISTAVAMCREASIDISEIIEKQSD
jgi:prophage antirepressor-like protein